MLIVIGQHQRRHAADTNYQCCISIYGHHLANTVERSILSSSAICHCLHYSNLFSPLGKVAGRAIYFTDVFSIFFIFLFYICCQLVILHSILIYQQPHFCYVVLCFSNKEWFHNCCFKMQIILLFFFRLMLAY